MRTFSKTQPERRTVEFAGQTPSQDLLPWADPYIRLLIEQHRQDEAEASADGSGSEVPVVGRHQRPRHRARDLMARDWFREHAVSPC